MFGRRIENNYSNYSLVNFSGGRQIELVKGDLEIGIKVSLLVVVGVLSIIANSMIIYAIYRHKDLRSSTNLCILNLCFADLIFSLYSPWAFIITDTHHFYVLKEFNCRFGGFFLMACMLVCGMTITFISCERMMAVVYPFQKHQITSKIAVIILSVIWLTSVCTAAPLFVWKVYIINHWSDYETIISCTQNVRNHYATVVIILLIYIPMTVTILAHTIIISKMDKYNRLLINKQHPLQLKYRNKVVRMLFSITIVYFICWLPFQVRLMNPNILNPKNKQMPEWLATYINYIAHFLVFLNAAINPLIYGIANENIKKAVKESFSFLFPKKRVHPENIDVRRLSNNFNLQNKRPAALPVIEIQEL